MTQSSLHGHDVDPCRDELASNKVTQVVNPHTGQSKALAVAPPPQRHGTGGQRRVAERVRPPNVTVGWDRHPGGKQRFALHAPQRAQEPKRFGVHRHRCTRRGGLAISDDGATLFAGADRAPNRDRLVGEVDVRPAQPERLATPEPNDRQDAEQRAVVGPLALDRIECSGERRSVGRANLRPAAGGRMRPRHLVLRPPAESLAGLACGAQCRVEPSDGRRR